MDDAPPAVAAQPPALHRRRVDRDTPRGLQREQGDPDELAGPPSGTGVLSHHRASVTRVEILDLHGRALALMGDVVARVSPAQLWWPTPCAGWTMHGLLRRQEREGE